MRVSATGKTVYLEVNIWFDEKTGQIHMAAPDTDTFHTTVNHTTVNADPDSTRGHPNLFGKLAGILRACVTQRQRPCPQN